MAKLDGPTLQIKYDCLLFDMDDTLYPLSTGLNLACRRNIEGYMLHHLHIDEKEVPRMCLELYKEYGTTMAGLKELGYEFDNDEFHEYVHGRLPYEKLKPDHVLRNLLLSMPQRKIIFTNGDKVHAAKVLSKLAIEDCFEGVICFETLNPSVEDKVVVDLTKPSTESDTTEDDNDDASDDSSDYGNTAAMDGCDTEDVCMNKSVKNKQHIVCKPSLEAFECAVRIANVDAKRTIFFDDSVRNIATAKAAGLVTVFVGSSSVAVTGADFRLNSIHNIREALPEIWECGEEEQIEQVIPHGTAVATAVLA